MTYACAGADESICQRPKSLPCGSGHAENHPPAPQPRPTGRQISTSPLLTAVEVVADHLGLGVHDHVLHMGLALADVVLETAGQVVGF